MKRNPNAPGDGDGRSKHPAYVPVPRNDQKQLQLIVGVNNEGEKRELSRYAPVTFRGKDREWEFVGSLPINRRMIRLAKGDVVKAETSMKRMLKDKEELEPAPKIWYEFYTGMKVETWILMWLWKWKGWDSDEFKFYYQLHIKGGAGQHGAGGVYLDFVWESQNTEGKKRVVVLEVDENAHCGYGWAVTRRRELTAVKHFMETKQPNADIFVMLRFNPHEYSNYVVHEKIPAGKTVFVEEHDRNQRLSVLAQTLWWAFGKPNATGRTLDDDGVTIGFMYYDKWYMDDDKAKPMYTMHTHHYAQVSDFKQKVETTSKSRVRFYNKEMFLRPCFWMFEDTFFPKLPPELRCGALNPAVMLAKKQTVIVGFDEPAEVSVRKARAGKPRVVGRQRVGGRGPRAPEMPSAPVGQKRGRSVQRSPKSSSHTDSRRQSRVEHRRGGGRTGLRSGSRGPNKQQRKNDQKGVKATVFFGGGKQMCMQCAARARRLGLFPRAMSLRYL